MKEEKSKNSIQFFENRKIRTVWDDEEQEWYFSVVDVVAVLTDSADHKQYIKKCVLVIQKSIPGGVQSVP